MKPNNSEILVGGASIFKEEKGKVNFLLFKNTDGDWEIPRTTVRRGESSVRAVIRYTTEQGNMNTRVLDEVGRISNSGSVNGRSVNYKYIYYLMFFKAGAEIVGMGEIAWYEYSKALKLLKLKKEQNILTESNNMAKEWLKKRKKK